MKDLPTLTAEDLDLALAWLIRRRLREFVKDAWALVEPGQRLIWGWHLDAMCEALEAVTRGEITRLLMNVPPRHMKSLLTSVFWPAWEWLIFPEHRFLSVSHSGPLAIRDAHKTRRLMQSEGLGLAEEDLLVFNHGEPATLHQRVGYRGILALIDNAWEFSGDQNLKSRYENDRTGYRISTSIGGGATGEGGDRIMIDDPHKLEEWDSEAALEEAVEFTTEVAPSRVNSKHAAIVMIMQRIHEQDSTAAVLGTVEDREGWGDVVHLCLPELYEPSHPFVCPAEIKLPAFMDPDSEESKEGATIAGDPRTEAGELLWRPRFDEPEVEAHKRIGALRYAGNYQQRPSPAEGNIFLREDWRYYGPGGDREDLPHVWQRTINSWDLTFGESDEPTSSWVVGQCWGLDGPDAYLLAQVRARMSFPSQKAAVRALRAFSPVDQADQRPMVIVEEKAAGKPLLEELKLVEPALKGVNPTTSKTARAISVQGYQENNNVYLPRLVIPSPPGYDPTPTNVFVDELAAAPASVMDQVDVFSQSLEELYRAQTDEAFSVQTAPDRAEPVVERGGKRFVGEKYVDKEPPSRYDP